MRDYSGYNPDNLYIDKGKYKDIREEIAQFVDIKTYHEILKTKADNYLKSEATKSLKPHIDGSVYNNNHYGIDEYDENSNKVTFNQLLSLICYCDLTEFSREWSATFRPVKFNESLDDIKKRNQNFYHFSKHFIEFVNVFGMSGDYDNPNGNENGPYYCGLNYPLTFPSYNIRLTAPCSTSKQLSVATRFSDQRGVILKFMNNDPDLHFFNCSWISAFKEEEERLFIAGNHPIKIINVTSVQNGKKYGRLVSVLSATDDILNGVFIEPGSHSTLNKQDIKYLAKLLDFLNDSNDLNKVDPYLKRLLLAYQLNKHQIVINFHYLYGYKSRIKNDLLSLFLYDGVKQYGYYQNSDVSKSVESNLVNLKYIYSCFKYLKKIIIYTTDSYGKHIFKCNHLLFKDKCILSIDSKKLEIEIQATRHHEYQDDVSWIHDLYSYLMNTDTANVKYTKKSRKQNNDILQINSR